MYGKVNTSIRILAFFILVLVFMFQGGYSQEYKKDALRTIPLKNIELKGYVGDKINLCILNRITAQDVDYLIEPFRHREEKHLWQTEFWGKWFTSAVFAYRYNEDSELKKKLDGAVRGLLETQTPDGYIGNYAAENRNTFWDIWGIKYSLLGLLYYYDITQDETVLNSAKRLADYLLNNVGLNKVDIVKASLYRGMPSSSVLEPIVLLYNLTKEERYLEFAEYIVNWWEEPEGAMLISKALDDVPVAGRFPRPQKWWSWENGQKAYEMMSCYEGLLELYRATGEETYLEAVKAAVQNIADTEINITGSGSSFECWYGGADRQTEQAAHPMETCVTMTWMKICENLFRLTGEPKYADLIEQSGYNALISAMKPDGSWFAKYTALVGTRKTGTNQCGMNINCCAANGPRGMMILPRIAVMTSLDGPVINLYCEGTAVVPLPEGHKVKIVQKTGYPVSDIAEIKIYPEKEKEFTLSLRIPQWSERSSVRINGKDSGTVIPGTYAKISRNWKAGDTVTIKFDFRGRVVRSPGDKHIYNAIVRGPIVLTRDSRLGDIDTDEVLTPLSKDGFIKLEEVAENKPGNILMVFKVPFSVGFELRGDYKKPVELLLCDFPSAGNTWDMKSRYRVWLPQHLNPAGESKY